MQYIIVGLGNPGEEYTNTRHNAGRIVLEFIAKKQGIADDKNGWKKDNVLLSNVAKGKIGKDNVTLLEPLTFMNKSGSALKTLITSEKKAESLIVIHDDLDIPLGSMKIVFNRGAGGHRGVESIIKNIKTEKFIRIRIGISPTTASGKIRKPAGDKIDGFIVGEFKKSELEQIQKIAKKINDVVEKILSADVFSAMTEFNG